MCKYAWLIASPFKSGEEILIHTESPYFAARIIVDELEVIDRDKFHIEISDLYTLVEFNWFGHSPASLETVSGFVAEIEAALEAQEERLEFEGKKKRY